MVTLGTQLCLLSQAPPSDKRPIWDKKVDKRCVPDAVVPPSSNLNRLQLKRLFSIEPVESDVDKNNQTGRSAHSDEQCLGKSVQRGSTEIKSEV